MLSPLILKTFSELECIKYKDGLVRPAYGHTIMGIIFVLFIIVLMLRSGSDSRAYLLFFSMLIIFIVFIIFALKTYTLKDSIFNASNNKANSASVKTSYIGEKRFFPISPSVGVLIGIGMFSILENFASFEVSNFVYISVSSIAVGAFFGVGLTYLYFEKKIHRQIRVQKYIKITKYKL